MCLSRIYLILLGTNPADPQNRLPAAQEWLLQFDAEEQDKPTAKCLATQLERVIDGVDEDELRCAFDWMRERGIINLCVDDGRLRVTIRNTLPVASGTEYMVRSAPSTCRFR